MPPASSIRTQSSRPPRPAAPMPDLSLLDLGTAGPGRYPTMQELRLMTGAPAQQQQQRLPQGGNMAGVGSGGGGGARSWYVPREGVKEMVEVGRRPQTMPVPMHPQQLQQQQAPMQVQVQYPTQPPPAHSPPRPPPPPSIAPSQYSQSTARQPPPTLNDFRRPTVVPVMPTPLSASLGTGGLQHPQPQLHASQHRPPPPPPQQQQQHIQFAPPHLPTPRPVLPPLHTPLLDRAPAPPQGILHRRAPSYQPELTRTKTSHTASPPHPVPQAPGEHGSAVAVQDGHRVLRKKLVSPPTSPQGPRAAPGTVHTSTAADLARARTVPARAAAPRGPPPVVTVPRRSLGGSSGGGGLRLDVGVPSGGHAPGSPEELRGWSVAREPETPGVAGYGAGGSRGGVLRVVNAGFEPETPVGRLRVVNGGVGEGGMGEGYGRFAGPEEVERRVGERERAGERMVLLPTSPRGGEAERSLEAFQQLAGIQSPQPHQHQHQHQQSLAPPPPTAVRRAAPPSPSFLPYLNPSPPPSPPLPPTHEPFTPSAQALINAQILYSPPPSPFEEPAEKQRELNEAVEYDVELPGHVTEVGRGPWAPEKTVFRAQAPPPPQGPPPQYAPPPPPPPPRLQGQEFAYEHNKLHQQHQPLLREYALPSGQTGHVQYDVPNPYPPPDAYYSGGRGRGGVEKPLVVFRAAEPPMVTIPPVRRESMLSVGSGGREGRNVLRKRHP